MIPFLLFIHCGYRSFILINWWYFMKSERYLILLKLVFHDFQGTFLWLSRFFVLLLNKIYGSWNSFYWKVCIISILLFMIFYDFIVAYFSLLCLWSLRFFVILNWGHLCGYLCGYLWFIYRMCMMCRKIQNNMYYLW